MKRYIIIISLLFTIFNIYAQQKVVERSAKKAPDWIGVAQADYVIVSAEDATLEAAKERCLANIRQAIISSVAVNISSKELSFDTQTIDGEQTEVLRRYESQVETVAAKLPFVQGVALDDAEIYWKKIYDKSAKNYKYEVHAKYPFPLLKRNSLVMEYMKIEQEHNEAFQRLKQSFETFTEIEYIGRAMNELSALYEYYIDQTRKNDVKVLRENYRKLYNSISIVPYYSALGDIVYYLNLEGRRMTTSRRPTIKSQYATEVSFSPVDDNMYRITYNYKHCQTGDDNKIDVTYSFASGAVARHSFHFDITENKVQLIPYGQIELDVEVAKKGAIDEEAASTEEQPAKIKGWLNLRAKYDTPFTVVGINFSADGTRVRVNSELNEEFEGKGTHRLSFSAEGYYQASERRVAMANGVIAILNKATNKKEEIRFYLPYKIVVKNE